MRREREDTSEFINSYLNEVGRALENLDKDSISRALEIITHAYKTGNTVFIFGNGGSASTASHMAADLSKGTLARVYDKKEKRLKVVSLTDNVALLSAYANDLSYEEVFVQQLRNLVKPRDVVIALSGSGESPNVIKAVRYAKTVGAKTISVSGFKNGGRLGRIVDCPIIVRTSHYGPIEDTQLVIDHLLTSLFTRAKRNLDGVKSGDNPSTPF